MALSDSDKWFWAVDKNDTETMRKMLNNGWDPSGQLYDSQTNTHTSLSRVVGHGNVEIVNLIIKSLANIHKDNFMQLGEELVNGYCKDSFISSLLSSKQEKLDVITCNNLIDGALETYIMPKLGKHESDHLRNFIRREQAKRNGGMGIS